jgi:hypothetical protein
MKPFTGLASRLLTRAFQAVLAAGLCLSATSAHALLIGAGQTATVDFSFGTTGAPQPLLFNLEVTTSGVDQFDDSAGLFSLDYLGLDTPAGFTGGYDATGGVTSLGVLSLVIATTDITGSVKFGSLTESIDVISVTLEIIDDLSGTVISTTSLTLPPSVDAEELSGPGALAIIGLGLMTLGAYRRRG